MRKLAGRKMCAGAGGRGCRLAGFTRALRVHNPIFTFWSDTFIVMVFINIYACSEDVVIGTSFESSCLSVDLSVSGRVIIFQSFIGYDGKD